MCLSLQRGGWFPYLSATLCGQHAHNISKFVGNLKVEVTTQLESKKEYMPHVPCVGVEGSLMYLMVCTRPDLA